MDLTGDERFDERIGRLRVQTQRVTQTLQFSRLLQERLLQSISTGVEVLLDRVQSHVQNCALIWREILLNLQGKENKFINCISVAFLQYKYDNSVIHTGDALINYIP